MGFGNLANGTSAATDRFVYMYNDGRLAFGVYPGTYKTVVTAASYNDGAWHLVDATLGAGGMALYVDGTLRASDATVTTAANYSGLWRAGGDTLSGWPGTSSSFWFAGTLDEAAVYNRALTAGAVAAHWAAAH